MNNYAYVTIIWQIMFFGLLGIQLEPKLKQVYKLFIQLNQSRFASCLSQKRKVFEVYLSWRRPEKAPK